MKGFFFSFTKLPSSCPTTYICSKRVQRWCKHAPTIKLLLRILCAHTHTHCTHNRPGAHKKRSSLLRGSAISGLNLVSTSLPTPASNFTLFLFLFFFQPAKGVLVWKRLANFNSIRVLCVFFRILFDSLSGTRYIRQISVASYKELDLTMCLQPTEKKHQISLSGFW